MIADRTDLVDRNESERLRGFDNGWTDTQTDGLMDRQTFTILE